MSAILFTEPVFATVVESGDQLFFFEVGTTDDLVVYTDFALSAAATQPVIADSDGRFPPLYIDSTGNDPRVVLEDVDGVEKWTVERFPISDISSVESSVTTNTSNITSLTGRITTAESEIDTLQLELDDAEDRLDTIEGAQSVDDVFGGSNTGVSGVSGHIIFPGGLNIAMAWGRSGDLQSRGTESFTFPVTFTQAPIVLIGHTDVNQDGVELIGHASSVTVSGLTVEVERESGSGNDNETAQVSWLAVGTIVA